MHKKVTKDDYFFENVHNYNIDERNRTLYVHAEPEPEESTIDFRMAAKMIKNLDYLNSINNEPITIKFITYGGCWNYGMAMYDAMKNSKSKITSISYAHARSMSSIIPQASSKRLIHKHCDFMIHYGTYTDEGDLRKVIEGVKHGERAIDTMINIYAEKCINGTFFKENSLTLEEVREFLKDKMERKVDWWLNAEEAVYYGFMDEVI